MKRTAIILLAAVLLIAALGTLCACNKQESAPAPQTEAVALKDNAAEAEYQIKVAFQDWLAQAYGDDVVDARIYVEKIYNTEEEQSMDVLKEMNLGPDEVAFEVRFELLPAEGADILALTVPNGEQDPESGWIKEKFVLGVLRPSTDVENGYVVTNIGTGW